MSRLRAFPLLAVVLAACSNQDNAPSSLPLSPLSSASANSAAVGQVYTASNSATGNAILAFDRAANGSLTPAGSYSTGGLGTGAGLGNQGGVVLTESGRELLVVNAGSDNVSSFRIRSNGSLELIGTYPSGGVRPISVTESRGIVYVLNAGGAGGITGFTMKNGALSMIPGSTRPLSGAGVGPAQVQFARKGSVLVVTEKGSNSLDTYTVNAKGVASGPSTFASSGATPFGFGVANGLVVVSEAFGGATDASALSSYEVGRNGALHLISGSVGTTETAACWVVLTEDGRFAYTTNAGSNTVSGYAIHQGALTLLDPSGVTATTDAGPIDMAATRNSRFVYALTSAGHSINGFAVGGNGALTPVSAGATALPAGTNGLVAR